MTRRASEKGFDSAAADLLDGVGSFDAEAIDRLRAVIGKLSRRLRTTLAAGDLTPSQISVLFTVVRRGPIGVAELADFEAMNPTMVSRVTTRLGELGLIQREQRADDRRAATVVATAAGRRLRQRVHLERSRALREHVAELDDAERSVLLAAIPALEVLAEHVAGPGR